MFSPIKLKSRPTTTLELVGTGTALISFFVLIYLYNQPTSHDYILFVIAILGTIFSAFTLRSHLREKAKRRQRVLALPPFPARVIDIKSSWITEGQPTFSIVLRGQDGAGVGGDDRWHDVAPPPHWVPQLAEGTTLLVRWNDDLEHAFVDWDASKEYREQPGYRS